jgi:hypothetical protein
MFSRLFINIFLQVQVDGPGLCEQAISDSPFGYVLVMHTSHDLNIDFRSICWVGRSSEESRCNGSGLGGVNNSIGNSATLIDYDRLNQGTDGCKKSKSDSMVPFLKHMGAQWTAQQIADSATLARTFEPTSQGMIDTQVTTGMMGITQLQEWHWTEAPMEMVMGGTFLGFFLLVADA